VPADRLAEALEVFHRWVASRGLRPSEVEYLAATGSRCASPPPTIPYSSWGREDDLL
jgi:hypothetical protein